MDSGSLAATVTPVVNDGPTSPGSAIAFPVEVQGADQTADLSFTVSDADGLDVEVPDDLTVAAGNATGVWILVNVPSDAEERDHEVVAQVRDGSGSKELTFTVRVSSPDDPVQEGEMAQIRFTLRYANGTVIATNRRAIANSSMPKAGFYQQPRSFRPVNISTGPRTRFPSGAVDALIGMGVGHTRTVSVPPAQAFGNATIRSEQPREETIERNRTLQRVFDGPREQFGDLIDDSTQEGDIVTAPYSGTEFPFNVTHLNDTHAELTMHVSEGDTFTQVDPWPDSSEVVRVNATEVTLRVTPPVDVDEPYTHNPQWPNATEVVQMNQTTIVIRHSPEIGTTYTQQGRRGPVQFEVVDLTADAVVVERPNPSPLGGETIVFDLTVLDKAQPRPQPGGMGGR